MVTSRTGTTAWKNLRKYALRQAQLQGLTRCPSCKTPLNYLQGRTPSSAEVDHIIPHSRGGLDRIDNVTVLCRACNQSKGNRTAPKPKSVMARTPLVTKMPLKTSRDW